MVTKGYRKTFFDKQNLYLLVNFRIEGYPISSLAALFHCDKRAVRIQCTKYAIVPIIRFLPMKGSPMLPVVIPESSKSEWYIEEGRRINAGRSYKDYLCSPSKGRYLIV